MGQGLRLYGVGSAAREADWGRLPSVRSDVETIVVGAGHAGLAASWALHQRGMEHAVLEEGGIGQTWRADRWSSFRLNTARWMSRLPGQSAADPDGFELAVRCIHLSEGGIIREKELPCTSFLLREMAPIKSRKDTTQEPR